MGEFADIANERWADGDWEEDQEDEGPFPSTKTCRYCGAHSLMWNLTDDGLKWRLVDQKGELHVCDKYKRNNN